MPEPKGCVGLVPEGMAEWLERMGEACEVKARFLEEEARDQTTGGAAGPWRGRERERLMVLMRVRQARGHIMAAADALRGALAAPQEKPKNIGDILAGIG